jgi:2-methylcitrate dehydratase PrpD
VVCYGTRLVMDSLPYAMPETSEQAQFSMPFAIACTLLYGTVAIDHLAARHLADTSLRKLMSQVCLTNDRHGLCGTGSIDAPEACHVEFHLHDGRTLSRTVLAATGMPNNPANGAQLDAKFLACACRAMPASDSAQLLERLKRLPQLRSFNGWLDFDH